MNKEAFFINLPVTFKKGIQVYPPTVKQVVSDNLFYIFTQILTYSQEDIEDAFMEDGQFLEKYPSPFEYLLNNSYHNKEYELYTKKAFEFFTHKKISFLYEAKKIVFGEMEEVLKTLERLEDLIFLEEEDFFAFQNLIREAIGKDIIEPLKEDEHPKIKEMKRKARYRDRIKQKQNQKKGITLHTSLVSICCMGVGITPLNIGEMSYVAISDIMNKYQDKEKYNLDIKTILAGGDSKRINPKYWIRNFDE